MLLVWIVSVGSVGILLMRLIVCFSVVDMFGFVFLLKLMCVLLICMNSGWFVLVGCVLLVCVSVRLNGVRMLFDNVNSVLRLLKVMYCRVLWCDGWMGFDEDM